MAWTVERMIVLGYYDGPTQGLVRLQGGDTYRFEAVAFDIESDRRVLKLWALSSASFEHMAQVLTNALGEARWPIWVPHWNFRSDVERLRIEREVEQISPRDHLIAVALCDDTVEFCVKMKDINDHRAAEVTDWFGLFSAG